jgi:2,4-dienoyl-CoA reductase-like NADH-dependent reductase (Old Yellow Enzyme family)
MTPELFSPITLRNLTLKNRIWIAPMCQYSAVDGKVGPWHLMHLGSFASGGTGLIIAEASGVLPEGRISVGCPGLWSDEVAESWRPIIEFVHSLDTKIGIQLAHAGRKGSRRQDWVGGNAEPEEGGWQVVGPSANAYHGYPTARALEIHEIQATVQAFADAARRAVAVGFDMLEVHAAHGYLLHQFLSPLTNERTDDYGGSFENRIRLLMEVIQAVRGVMPEGMPLFVRISATDWVDGGWDLDQSIKLAKLMKAEGVDLVHVSSAGLVHEQKVVPGPHFQVPFATAIRNEAHVPTAAVGLITDPVKANAIIANGEADAVCIARAAMRNPRWPFFAAEALGHRIDLPSQLMRSRTV